MKITKRQLKRMIAEAMPAGGVPDVVGATTGVPGGNIQNLVDEYKEWAKDFFLHDWRILIWIEDDSWSEVIIFMYIWVSNDNRSLHTSRAIDSRHTLTNSREDTSTNFYLTAKVGVVHIE